VNDIVKEHLREGSNMKALVKATLFRDAGNVRRYHTQRTLRQQTVAEHSFGVLMLVLQVEPIVSLHLIKAVCHHDLPELMTGDIPAPAKRAHPQMDTYLEEFEASLEPLYYDTQWLNHDEQALLKWADTMELVLWCLEEWRMGNHTTGMGDMVRRGLGWVLQKFVPMGARVLTQEIVDDAVSLGLSPFTGNKLEELA
jgi:5'-deoxynucleotidase YfbR-like HD superfamily hydrolase